jgi:hypothetical protein
MTRLLLAAIALPLLFGPVVAQGPGERAIILITLDGARVEEVFGGLDVEIVRSTLKPGQAVEQQPLYRDYWAATPEARREKLMPFFWGTLMRAHGSIAGNQSRGSRVRVSNPFRISYPGYSEILVGRADDGAIRSNDPIRNPNATVLEFLREQIGAAATGVAVFASWDVFNAIAEHDEGRLTVNAGYERYDSLDPAIRRLSEQQFVTPTPWDSVRHDEYTFAFAMDHLARHRPRVLYLALGETDDWAHDGRYDRVLQAYTRSDRYLGALWTWLQSQPEYRDRTSLLITTDHGRGRTPRDWRDHGKDVAGAADTWMAFISPFMSQRGEWRDSSPITASQVAATLVGWMGLNAADFRNAAPAIVGSGPPR